MKVTTVSASVRYSMALGDGVHKTVELSAEAMLDDGEMWKMAQANLYEELTGQLKALWGNGTQQAPGSPERGSNGSNHTQSVTRALLPGAPDGVHLLIIAYPSPSPGGTW